MSTGSPVSLKKLSIFCVTFNVNARSGDQDCVNSLLKSQIESPEFDEPDLVVGNHKDHNLNFDLG